MKFERVYCYSRTNKKSCEDDFLIGYKAENGKYIKINFSIDNQSFQWYTVDGKSYTTLKAAKEACEVDVLETLGWPDWFDGPYEEYEKLYQELRNV